MCQKANLIHCWVLFLFKFPFVSPSFKQLAVPVYFLAQGRERCSRVGRSGALVSRLREGEMLTVGRSGALVPRLSFNSGSYLVPSVLREECFWVSVLSAKWMPEAL